jgi:zinc transporter, ZIP family
MLPHSKEYLIDGGYSEQAAAYLLIGLFLVGVAGIQIISRFLHHYIPSHVVDCDHTHEHTIEDEEGQEEMEEHHDHDHSKHYINGNNDNEDTPLLSRDASSLSPPKCRNMRPASQPAETYETLDPTLLAPSLPPSRRPSIQWVLTTKVVDFGNAIVSGVKHSCDEGGPCYGYSEPCGHECLKAATIVSRRGSFAARFTRAPSLVRINTNINPFFHPSPLPEVDEEASISPTATTSHPQSPPSRPSLRSKNLSHSSFRSVRSRPPSSARSATSTRHISTHIPIPKHEHAASDPQQAQAHHHHVPQNAFLSIGLQTAIAIALHKMPEGFITFATNHASPSLGLSVFIALFIHNISEGFAMALPLYLALQSRPRAIIWSSILGGVSQPLGAGVAALWFKISANVGNGNLEPGARVYGGMFAVTAGIMTSVALQLFEEALCITHRKGWVMVFAFVGMGVLGLSFALTAGRGHVG